MEVLAVIPARGGSKSIPRKNIKKLGDHPLIAYSIAAALRSKSVNRIIVSTDDNEIASIAKSYGAEVPFIRPSSLSEDDTLDYPVFVHVVEWLLEQENYKPGALVQLRPTSPFRELNYVDRAVQILKENEKGDSVRSVISSQQNPYKMWRQQDGFIQPLIQSKLNESYNMPRQQLPPTFWQTGHVDVIKHSTIINQNSLTGNNVLPLIVNPKFAIDLDTIDQWEYAEFFIKKWSSEIVFP